MRKLKVPPKKSLPGKDQRKSEERGCDSLLNFGSDALLSVINQSTSKALEIYSHDKPGECVVDERQDITRLNIRQVGQLHQYYVAMHAFAIQELARADQETTIAEYEHDVMKKTLQIQLDAGQQKYKLDAELSQNPKLRRLWESVLAKRAYKDMLSAMSRGLENKAAMTSREISRRSAERSQQ